MYTRDKLILYSLSRPTRNRFPAVGSRYHIVSNLQPVAVVKVAICNFSFFFTLFYDVFVCFLPVVSRTCFVIEFLVVILSFCVFCRNVNNVELKLYRMNDF